MLKVDEAIRIAKIIEYAPEDRLPLIVDVFNQAGVDIETLQCAAGFKIDNLIEQIMEKFPHYKDGKDGAYQIPAVEFTAYCRQENIDPYQARAALARRGILQTCRDSDKTKYSVPVKKDGTTVRCVILKLD